MSCRQPARRRHAKLRGLGPAPIVMHIPSGFPAKIHVINSGNRKSRIAKKKHMSGLACRGLAAACAVVLTAALPSAAKACQRYLKSTRYRRVKAPGGEPSLWPVKTTSNACELSHRFARRYECPEFTNCPSLGYRASTTFATSVSFRDAAS